MRRFALLAALFAAGCGGGGDLGLGEAKPTVFRVVNVRDGSTLVIRRDGVEVPIRLHRLSVPGPKQAFGQRARTELSSLVRDKSVRLEFEGLRKDAKGRELAYVFVDQTFVNLEMVRRGLADLDLRDSDGKHGPALRAARQSAKAGKRGIWAPRAKPNGVN